MYFTRLCIYYPLYIQVIAMIRYKAKYVTSSPVFIKIFGKMSNNFEVSIVNLCSLKSGSTITNTQKFLTV